MLPRATRYRLSGSYLRLRVRNRALAENLPLDRQAASYSEKSACLLAMRNQFELPITKDSSNH